MIRQTLLFDLDGTLVDSVPDLTASLNRVMQVRQLDIFQQREVAMMVGDGAAALVQKAMAARGRQAASGDIDDFLVDYTAHAAIDTRPYPDVAVVLDELRSRGWRLGVCTNKPERPARAVLKALGLLDRFVAIAGGDTYPTRKPHPGHLLGLLKTMDARPLDAVMVGDHHNDVIAAAAAGIPCIFAAWGYGTPNMATGTIAIASAFRDLPGLLAELP